MNNGLYRFAHALMRVIYAIFLPRKVYGGENLPAEGGYILCANHMSARDPIFLATCLPAARGMRFLAKKELFAFKPLAALLKTLGAIPVDRGASDMSAIRAAREAVKNDCALMIFPQGTRSRDNSRTPLLSGAAMIAMLCRVPLIPAYIDGPYHLIKHSDVHFGKAIDLNSFGARPDQETLQKITDKIGDEIWSFSC